MPISWARRSAWIAGALLILTVLVVVGLPWLASTQIVRDRIAQQMSAWSGYRVELDQTAEIQVWPTFRAVLKGVTLSDWDRENPYPVLQTERMEIDLSALAALRGKIIFTEMELTRPVLRLTEQDETLGLPTPHSWGRLARSVATARAVVEASPSEPDTTALPRHKLGKIIFRHGRVVTGTDENQQEIITSLTGTFNWPALNRPASLTAEGIWRGESASLSVSSSQPLILFGGGNAPLELALEAAPASASYNGSASFSAEGFVDGQLSLSSPALDRLSEWIGLGRVPITRIGPARIAAHLSGSSSRLKLEDATLALDNSTGTGLLDISLTGGRPSLVGTLAFDTLDLKSLVDTFNPLPSTRPSPIPQEFDYDLRFSAETADFGQIRLSNIAAATRTKNGLTTFDISDATVFGGNFQLGMRTEQTSRRAAMEIRMQGEGIQMGQLADTLERQRLIPRAPANFSVVLTGTGDDMESAMKTVNGNVSLDIGAGSIPGLDLDAFLRLAEEGDFFPMAALGEGSLTFERANVKATLQDGVADIQSAEAASGDHRISLNGLVSLTSRGLALYGTLADAENGSQVDTPLTFFIGGSWAAPFIASFHPAGTGTVDSE
ncbi:AsmA family protein [Chelativorans sp. YIM 93263]|uniref:AsmA family protein n=1 Tax=Chelativorans sp. YIM 93263 TaxID=2906648 RepID=UPI00237946F2|nr:AsmA family protein [Chelativorans sp. YIM 93263]